MWRLDIDAETVLRVGTTPFWPDNKWSDYDGLWQATVVGDELFGATGIFGLTCSRWVPPDILMHPVRDRSVPYPNVLPDLAHTMKMNPGLGVLVQQGYYDLATPYFIADYYMKHMDIPAAARERIRVEYYEAGHMMYVHPPSMEKYREDLARFIRETDRVEP